MANDIDLTIRFDSAPRGTVYLSVSWQPDKGKDFGYRVVRRLDEEGYLAIGDAKGLPEMEPKRLHRIMSQADGFLSVLPFRPDKPGRTSGFMLDELDLAIGAGLPIAVLHDSRVEIKETIDAAGETVTLEFQQGRKFLLPKSRLVMRSAFDLGVDRSEDRQILELSDFFARVAAPSSKKHPFSFLICRLQPDFELPRAACLAAAESASGIRSLWIDSNGYATNVDDTVERARLLIKNSEFVVAEISLTEENPEHDNPSRAHEIGLATAYLQKVFPVSHVPRRHPYHALVARQLMWWEDEEQLFKALHDAIYAERGSLGRHVYNWELESADPKYQANFRQPSFTMKEKARWRPPAAREVDPAQSWVYAVSFGVLAGCSALLLRKAGYEDTLDLAALFAGIVAFFFSSRLNRSIQRALGRLGYLRWLIPLLAALFLVAVIVVFRPEPAP